LDEENKDTVDLRGAKVTFVQMDGGATYSLTEWDMQVGYQGPPIHIHHNTDEGFYVMEGHVGFVMDAVTTYGKPGTHVFVPQGHSHSFWNAGVRPAKLLHLISPPGFEEYFRELAARLGDTSAAEDPIEVRKELGEKYDIEVVGQPPGLPRQT
jgi:mannose-6-phosphate isomerase-like protein (cupin superfamily)